MQDTPEDQPEPQNLRFLRTLVTVLTATMIAGLLVIIALIVIRFSDRGPTLPEEIALPEGTTARAVTFGDGWYAVVTGDDRILIFDASSGKLRQSVTID